MGVRTPLHCAADGKVLLASDGARLGRTGLAQRTKRTIVEPKVLTRELASVRRRGFALAEGELEEGLVGVAVPFWEAGSCIAALCVSGPEYRLDGKTARALASKCLASAKELERLLGAEGSPKG